MRGGAEAERRALVKYGVSETGCRPARARRGRRNAPHAVWGNGTEPEGASSRRRATDRDREPRASVAASLRSLQPPPAAAAAAPRAGTSDTRHGHGYTDGGTFFI